MPTLSDPDEPGLSKIEKLVFCTGLAVLFFIFGFAAAKFGLMS